MIFFKVLFVLLLLAPIAGLMIYYLDKLFEDFLVSVKKSGQGSASRKRREDRRPESRRSRQKTRKTKRKERETKRKERE